MMKQGMIDVRYAQDLHPKGHHFHDCYQLLYVVSGRVSFTVSGKEYNACPGTLVLVGRFENHAIGIDSGDYRRYTVMIAPDILTCHPLLGDRLLAVLTNRPATFCHAVQLPDKAQAERILEQMAAESGEGRPMGERMLVLLLSQLLILFCRQQPDTQWENPGNLALIQQVRQYLEEHFASKCSLEDLAARFHMSQSYLSHLFKNITGSSVLAYLTAYRLVQAKHMLIETDMEIGKISTACGFSDHSNFGRTFRAQTGLTPLAFRHAYRVTRGRGRMR